MEKMNKLRGILLLIEGLGGYQYINIAYYNY